MVVALAMCGCERPKPVATPLKAPEPGGTGQVQAVAWVKSRDYTITENGAVFAVDFGFRSDGVLLWRRGDKL